MEEIRNEDLTIEMLPDTTATVEEMMKFALRYNGYEKKFSGYENVGDLANDVQSKWRKNKYFLNELSIDELRGCLFFEQRRFRHFGWDPGEEDLIYWHPIIEQIRIRIAAA